MPKASMNENNRSKARENDVGRTGQILAMKSKPVPKAVRYAADL
jgi:hypothetical protein